MKVNAHLTQPTTSGHKENSRDAILAGAAPWMQQRPRQQQARRQRNQSSEQIDATNAIDRIVDNINDGVNRIDGIDGISNELMNLIDLVSWCKVDVGVGRNMRPRRSADSQVTCSRSSDRTVEFGDSVTNLIFQI